MWILSGKSKKLLNNIIKIYLMVVEKNKELHVPIESEIFHKLEDIKVYHGIKNNTEIIRFLITKEHRKIQKTE
ncbi:unnamed protein product [marine sediment metagenome]|uniref:Uncharacterized protein n=1 Tax=marine sediment metagenome TaxID=412755 RepID=X1IB50_9ZZZZ